MGARGCCALNTTNQAYPTESVPKSSSTVVFDTSMKYAGYACIAYEMCEVLEGGGDIEKLDKTVKKFLEYVKQL
jgi:fatty acid-binding protein DegV